jgi:hypothetical protein
MKIELKKHQFDQLERVSPQPHYSIGFWKGQGRFGFCIGRQSFRVELYFGNDANKILIDTMLKFKDEIQNNISDDIIWERLDMKKASRIRIDMTKEDVAKLTSKGKFNEEVYWEELIEWYSYKMAEFFNVVNPVWEKVQKQIS